MDINNILKNEEVRNNLSVFIRELIDIERYQQIEPAMLDTNNRKFQFSDIVIEFQKNDTNIIKIIKNRYCSKGIYFHEDYLNEKSKKIEELQNEITNLKLELIKKVEEITTIKLKKNKSFKIFDKFKKKSKSYDNILSDK